VVVIDVIVWLDFEPTKGREIGKYRPALVLSSREYNRKTGLLICCGDADDGFHILIERRMAVGTTLMM
jgi:mRNA-degrading endonuclease toxin of MazEF toxin-antitoxin module